MNEQLKQFLKIRAEKSEPSSGKNKLLKTIAKIKPQKGRQTRRSRLKINRRLQVTFVSTISLLLLSAVLALIVGISAFAPAFAGSISDIEVATQQTSGATTTNYMPILAEGINWADLSDDERAGTARYAVNSAAKLAEQNGVTDFNVMGISPTDKQPVFLYTGGKTLSIHLDGTSQTISLNE